MQATIVQYKQTVLVFKGFDEARGVGLRHPLGE